MDPASRSGMTAVQDQTAMNPNLRFHIVVAKIHSAIPIHVDMTDQAGVRQNKRNRSNETVGACNMGRLLA